MQEHFNQEIENLKTSLIKMASLVDEQTNNAFKALETGKIELCENIKRKDLEIDSYDNLIQIQCENILALFQPVAIDLRFVISALMINNQLERCGDIAVNIAQRVKKTKDNRDLIAETNIIEMGNNARKMLSNVIDAFINNDLNLAKLVIENDETVDKLNKESFKFLVRKMKENAELIEACSHLIVLTRHIERLADHATNIAENVVFYIEAKVIAHEKKLGKLNSDNENS